MLNRFYREKALGLLQSAQDKYNVSCEAMNQVSGELYSKRRDSLSLIGRIESFITGIVGAPREFNATLETVSREKKIFKEKEEYAEEAFNTEKAGGEFMAAGAVIGLGISAALPQGLKMIATTYGTTSAGVAIKTLKGAAKNKAANAWIGRNIGKMLVKKGSNAAAGKAVLAIAGAAGPVLTAADMGITMWTVSEKNRKTADEAVEDAKEIEVCREAMDETREKIAEILLETEQLYDDLALSMDELIKFEGADFDELSAEDQTRLVILVRNTQSLAKLLNETVD